MIEKKGRIKYIISLDNDCTKMETDIYPKTKCNIVVQKEEKMSEPVSYPIIVAICFTIAGIIIYSAVYHEIKKAQKAWEKKGR